MMDLESFKALLDLGQTIAIVLGAVVGIRGLNSWQTEMIARRKAEVAENAMALFHEAEDIIVSACRPFKLGPSTADGEIVDRTDNPLANFAARTASDLDATPDFWGRFAASKYPAQAIFGNGVDEPYRSFEEIRRDIRVMCATIETLHTEALPGETPDDREDRINALIEILHGPEFRDRAADAVARMADICHPAIKGFYAR